MNEKSLVYFGAMDRQMDAFLDSGAFWRTLVHGVLFHGDLVIPDVLFYNSQILGELVTNDAANPRAKAFLAYSVRTGAVIPAFREECGGSFLKNLEMIKNVEIDSRGPSIAEFLERSLKGVRGHSVIWSNEPFSVGYKNTLEKTLLADSLSSGSVLMEKFWEDTKELRSMVISSTVTDDRGGLRRGDIWRHLINYLHPRDASDYEVRSVWAAVNSVEDPVLRLASQRFLKWLDYSYQFNQAKMLTLHPSLLAMDDLDSEFSRYLADLPLLPDSAKHFIESFQLPSPEALLTIDPVHIFELRDSDTGENYFAALATWQASQTDETANVLLDALKIYAKRLVAIYLERGGSVVNWVWHLRANVPAGPSHSHWRGFREDSSIEAFMQAIGSQIPFFSATSLIGKLAAATYQSLPSGLAKSMGELLGVGNRVQIDAEPRVSRIIPDGEGPTKIDASFS